jgi:hypothetical protein
MTKNIKFEVVFSKRELEMLSKGEYIIHQFKTKVLDGKITSYNVKARIEKDVKGDS